MEETPNLPKSLLGGLKKNHILSSHRVDFCLEMTKGQTISKANYGLLNSSKKQTQLTRPFNLHIDF